MSEERPKKIVFTCSAGIDLNACPEGATLELRGVDMLTGRPASDHFPCVGGHAAGENHRTATGYQWPGATAGAGDSASIQIGFATGDA